MPEPRHAAVIDEALNLLTGIAGVLARTEREARKLRVKTYAPAAVRAGTPAIPLERMTG